MTIAIFIIIAALVGLSYWLLFVLPRRRQRPWSPFDENGYIRDDLMAVKLVDGKWVTNPKPNDGFYPIGTIAEDGIK